MGYDTFQKTITSELQNRLGGGFRLIPQKVPKNNGLVLDGLSICPGDQRAAPTIYLNHYYERFRGGASMDTLVEEIMGICREDSPVRHADFSILEDFSRLKDRVAFRLIHTESNRELLADIPSVPWLDLSIVFYLYLEENRLGQMTALIHNRHLPMWNTTAEELYTLAGANTSRLLPAEIKTISQVIRDMGNHGVKQNPEKACPGEPAGVALPPGQGDFPMYVLSNSAGFNGACVILYPNVLGYVADTVKKDLVILPSSVHEVLLVPYEDGINAENLSRMVASINREQVLPEDRLSDHVYFYSRENNLIISGPGGSAPLSSAPPFGSAPAGSSPFGSAPLSSAPFAS